jgi:chromate transport protein ChrA
MTVKHRHLVVAAVLTVATALALAGLAWWFFHDRADTDLWAWRAVRAIAAVVLSKAGFKGALAIVIALVAGVAWMRSRRRSAGAAAAEAANREAVEPADAPPALAADEAAAADEAPDRFSTAERR